MLQFIADNVEDFWRYMPISRRFLRKKYIFPHFSRILPLQVRQSLFTIALNNLQVAVFRQRSNIYKNKSTVSVLLPDFFRPCFIIWVTLTYLITAMNKNQLQHDRLSGKWTLEKCDVMVFYSRLKHNVMFFWFFFFFFFFFLLFGYCFFRWMLQYFMVDNMLWKA